jgi:hypothetical protein
MESEKKLISKNEKNTVKINNLSSSLNEQKNINANINNE